VSLETKMTHSVKHKRNYLAALFHSVKYMLITDYQVQLYIESRFQPDFNLRILLIKKYLWA